MGPSCKCLVLHSVFVWLPVTLPGRLCLPSPLVQQPPASLLCSYPQGGLSWSHLKPQPPPRPRTHSRSLLAALLLSLALRTLQHGRNNQQYFLLPSPPAAGPSAAGAQEGPLLAPLNPVPGSELECPLGNCPTSLSTCLPLPHGHHRRCLVAVVIRSEKDAGQALRA